MNQYDKLFANWAQQNAEAIYHHLETKINPQHNWRNEPILDIVSGYGNWPSQWESLPYVEELQHTLNDWSEELGVPLPPELIAYHLSLWAGSNVLVNHPLVQNCNHWQHVVAKMDFDDNTAEDEIQLIKLLQTIATGEAAENLPAIDDIVDHHEAQTVFGELYTINTNDSLLYLVIAKDKVAAMDGEGKVVILDFDGNRLPSGENTSRIQQYITQGLKFSRPITERGELASLVGNNTADMLLGRDGLSVFDLPDQY